MLALCAIRSIDDLISRHATVVSSAGLNAPTQKQRLSDLVENGAIESLFHSYMDAVDDKRFTAKDDVKINNMFIMDVLHLPEGIGNASSKGAFSPRIAATRKRFIESIDTQDESYQTNVFTDAGRQRVTEQMKIQIRSGTLEMCETVRRLLTEWNAGVFTDKKLAKAKVGVQTNAVATKIQELIGCVGEAYVVGSLDPFVLFMLESLVVDCMDQFPLLWEKTQRDKNRAIGNWLMYLATHIIYAQNKYASDAWNAEIGVGLGVICAFLQKGVPWFAENTITPHADVELICECMSVFYEGGPVYAALCEPLWRKYVLNHAATGAVNKLRAPPLPGNTKANFPYTTSQAFVHFSMNLLQAYLAKRRWDAIKYGKFLAASDARFLASITEAYRKFADGGHCGPYMMHHSIASDISTMYDDMYPYMTQVQKDAEIMRLLPLATSDAVMQLVADEGAGVLQYRDGVAFAKEKKRLRYPEWSKAGFFTTARFDAFVTIERDNPTASLNVVIDALHMRMTSVRLRNIRVAWRTDKAPFYSALEQQQQRDMSDETEAAIEIERLRQLPFDDDITLIEACELGDEKSRRDLFMRNQSMRVGMVGWHFHAERAIQTVNHVAVSVDFVVVIRCGKASQAKLFADWMHLHTIEGRAYELIARNGVDGFEAFDGEMPDGYLYEQATPSVHVSLDDPPGVDVAPVLVDMMDVDESESDDEEEDEEDETKKGGVDNLDTTTKKSDVDDDDDDDDSDADATNDDETMNPDDDTRSTNKKEAHSPKPAAASVNKNAEDEDVEYDDVCPVGKNSRVLCLGMCYTSAQLVAKLTVSEGTTNAPIRDRERILQLEAQFGCRVWSMNDGQKDGEGESGRHCNGTFGRRALSSMRSHFKETTFTHVFLDYIRFPGAYMFKAYGPFLKELLPAMVDCGMIRLGARVVVPNETMLGPFLDAIVTRIMETRFVSEQIQNGRILDARIDTSAASSSSSMTAYPVTIQGDSLRFERTYISADDYPLYIVTSTTSCKSLTQSMGGISNKHEIKQLGTKDDDEPFVLLTLVRYETSGKKRYQHDTKP